MRELVVPAINDNLDKVVDFVGAFLQETQFQNKQIIQVSIAVEEIFINIASYAYAPDVGSAKIICRLEGSKAIIGFVDSGKPYNPLLSNDPDVTQSAEQRGVGGLGVFMVKNLMDNINYKYEDGKNILIIEKNII